MRRALSFVWAALALSVLASCTEDLSDSSEINEKQIEISFSPVESRSVAAYSGEGLVNGVKLYVYRLSSDGTGIKHAEYYTETGSVSVKLPFPEGENRSYELRAYANFGNLSSEPSVVEFAGYFEYGMKMHGEVVLDEAAASSGSLSMMLRRYVGKVVANSVKLGWNSGYAEPFTLDAIYIANAGKDNSLNAECHYNIDGVRSVTDMDQYLYEDIGGISMNVGDVHSQQHFFYAFAGFSSENFTSLVFEVTYAGEKMYYTVPLDYLAENSCTVYDFVIIGAGCDKPYGEKMSIEKSAIEVMARSFTAEDWDTYNEKVYSEETGYVDTEVEVNPDYD